MFDAIYVRSLRAENANFRVGAKEATTALAQVGELLGLDADAKASLTRALSAQLRDRRRYPG